ncbi:MAG: alpha/beta hydrolase [Candidatus Marinimicrobia bacterium]|nr:alpha/beta hydrolase [Candidatus Neomarinimicrobiota bacterium]
MEDFSEFAAPETTCRVRNVPVNKNVTLKIISFSPRKVAENPVIIFVPGWISLMSGWKEVLIEMSRDFTIHYVETREKISSTVSGKVHYQVEDFARDISSLVDFFRLKDRDFILYGSSLGSTTIVDSCRFLTRQPLCMVLIGVNAVFYIPKFWQCVMRLFPPRLYLVFKPIIKWYLRNFRLDVQSDQAQYEKYCLNIDTADPWKLKKAALAFVRYAIWDRLPDIKIPALLISASKDEIHDLQNIRRISALMSNSTNIDLETNSNTHSAAMVVEMRKFVKKID